MDRLYLGIKGHVVCMEKESGRELWRRKLRSDMSGITNVQCDGKLVFATVSGYLYCLDAETGMKKWENGLRGLGHGYCIMANGDSSGSAAAAASSAAATAATTAAAAGAVVAGS